MSEPVKVSLTLDQIRRIIEHCIDSYNDRGIFFTNDKYLLGLLQEGMEANHD